MCVKTTVTNYYWLFRLVLFECENQWVQCVEMQTSTKIGSGVEMFGRAWRCGPEEFGVAFCCTGICIDLPVLMCFLVLVSYDMSVLHLEKSCSADDQDTLVSLLSCGVVTWGLFLFLDVLTLVASCRAALFKQSRATVVLIYTRMAAVVVVVLLGTVTWILQRSLWFDCLWLAGLDSPTRTFVDLCLFVFAVSWVVVAVNLFIMCCSFRRNNVSWEDQLGKIWSVLLLQRSVRKSRSDPFSSLVAVFNTHLKDRSKLYSTLVPSDFSVILHGTNY